MGKQTTLEMRNLTMKVHRWGKTVRTIGKIGNGSHFIVIKGNFEIEKKSKGGKWDI